MKDKVKRIAQRMNLFNDVLNTVRYFGRWYENEVWIVDTNRKDVVYIGKPIFLLINPNAKPRIANDREINSILEIISE